jgi:hypothetical protein
MSKYAPLKRHLESQKGSELPMTFAEIEKVLGFTLPDSARSHQPWWSNHVGSHVNAAAWRDAGWKTSRVDLAGERVTFVRDEAPTDARPPGVAEGGPAWEGADSLSLGNLPAGVQRMIDDWAEETGLDRPAAAAAILEAAALARRRRLLESFPIAVLPPGYDSTEIIRADRDSR